jgi:quercetin 2,3-dioxygenase
MKRIAERRAPTDMHWVGDGFPVRTYFAYDEPAPWSPFLLLDYAAPREFAPAAKRRGVGPHPHRGFETVTIVYAGEVEHRDSAGHGGRIGPGDVQWMTAGGGLVHEEMHGAAFTQSGGPMEMVQLWVNLPRQHKRTPPRYQDVLAGQRPAVALPNGAGTAQLIAGELLGATGPARTFSPILLADLQLCGDQPASLPVAPGHTTLVLVRRGRLRIGGEIVSAGELVRCDREQGPIELAASDGDAEALLLAGEPIAEPVVGHGPFVMNSWPEIREAIADFQAGRMGQLEA